MSSILNDAWRRGLDVLLWDAKLQARRDDGQRLNDSDRDFIREYREEIIYELESLTRGNHIDGAEFFKHIPEDKKMDAGNVGVNA